MIDPALTAAKSAPPSDSDDVAALHTTAKDLQDTAGEGGGAGADAANRLAKDINRLADGMVKHAGRPPRLSSRRCRSICSNYRCRCILSR